MRFRAIILLTTAALLVPPLASAQAAKPDFTSAHQEVAQILAALVRIDTSNPPGNEIKAAQHIKSILDREAIPSEIFESAPGRGNIVARLKGNGSKRPLLLMGHLDVVGVEREKWTVEPFAALVKDGYLYGRGASDDKAMTSACLEVFLLLHRLKAPLERDVIFLAEAGEEGTSQYGIDFMVKEHWDQIEAEFALNEGGGIHLRDDGKIDRVNIGTSEKVSRGMRLVARGSSGHGSIPRPDNPIIHLGAAVGKFGVWQPPMRLNETTRAFFQRLAKASSPEDAQLYTHLDDPAVQEKLRLTHPDYYSMLRTSIVPTIIKGGFRTNVIPGDAEASLDIRALPDEDIPALMAKMREIINDPEIEIVRGTAARPANPPSRIDTDMFRALERSQQRVFPAAVSLPAMGTGATDSAQLRAKGVQAYGLGSVATDEDRRGVHGNDERMNIEGLGKFVEFIYGAVVEVAGGK
jgi:acetylornithine deacetylase/succinyl-diaminopimelate desuccinylase-like protein